VQILHPYGPDKLSDSMEIIPGVSGGEAPFQLQQTFLHSCFLSSGHAGEVLAVGAAHASTK